MMMQKRLRDAKSAMELKEVISRLNTNGDNLISEEEFKKFQYDPAVLDAFEIAGLNITDVHTFFDTLCKVSGTHELDTKTFVEAAFQMKGFASSIDVQTLLFEMKETTRMLNRVKKSLGIKHKD